MKTRKAEIQINNNSTFTSELPINCPFCSAYIDPKTVQLQMQSYNSGGYLFFLTLFATCCSKKFLAVYETKAKYEDAKLAVVYPSVLSEKIPDSLAVISPRFAELFRQASVAESMGFIELAGSGYRNAIEVLIKDYAINELGKPSHEVSEKKLFDAIGKYVPTVGITAADVVRVLGNDYTHYQQKYEDIDFDIMKRYLHIFIQALENEYLLRNPVVKTNRPVVTTN